MAKSQPTIDYQSYVIKRQLEDCWRADEGAPEAFEDLMRKLKKQK